MRVLRNIVTYINVLFFFVVFTVLFPVYLIFKIFKFESYFVKFSFILMRFGINISLWLADVKVVVTRDNDACLSGKGSVVIMGIMCRCNGSLIFNLYSCNPFCSSC